MKTLLPFIALALLSSCEPDGPTKIQNRLNHTKMTFNYENESIIVSETYPEGDGEAHTWEVKATKIK